MLREETKQLIEFYECSKGDYMSLKRIREVSDVKVLEELLLYAKTTENFLEHLIITNKLDTPALSPYLERSYTYLHRCNYHIQGSARDIEYEDRYFELRMALAHNKYLPQELVRVLANDINPLVRYQLVFREDILEEDLKIVLNTALRYLYNGGGSLYIGKILLHKNFKDINIIEKDPLLKSYVDLLIESEWTRDLRLYVALHKKFKFEIETSYSETLKDEWFILGKVLETDGILTKKEICSLYEQIKEKSSDNKFRFVSYCELFFESIQAGSIIPESVLNDFFECTLSELKGLKEELPKFYVSCLKILLRFPFASFNIMKKVVEYALYMLFQEGVGLKCDLVCSKRIDLINYAFERTDLLTHGSQFGIFLELLSQVDMDLSGLSENAKTIIENYVAEFDYKYSSSSIKRKCAIVKCEKFSVDMLERISSHHLNPLVELALFKNPKCSLEVYKNLYNKSTTKYVKEQAKFLLESKNG